MAAIRLADLPYRRRPGKHENQSTMLIHFLDPLSSYARALPRACRRRTSRYLQLTSCRHMSDRSLQNAKAPKEGQKNKSCNAVPRI